MQPGPYQPAEISERYGVDRLVLLARDPYWLHAYWEITPETVREAEAQLGEGWEGHRWILRVRHFDPETQRDDSTPIDADLSPDAHNWYLRVPYPDRIYEATIGVITSEGVFYPFARSERVQTPRASESDVVDLEWSSDPEKAGQILALSGGGASRTSGGQEGRAEALQGGFSGMLGSMADRKSDGMKREFWLDAETDLIVYGRTKPGSTLSIQGRSAAVRSDGSFTLRLQLPDGDQEVACVATSADGQSKRIVLSVRRQTHVAQEASLNSSDDA